MNYVYPKQPIIDLSPATRLALAESTVAAQKRTIDSLKRVIEATPHSQRFVLAMEVVDALRPWANDGTPAQRSYSLDDVADDVERAVWNFIEYELGQR